MSDEKKSISNELASRVLCEDENGHSKKEKEKKYLTAILTRLGLENYCIEESERPDFFIHFKKDLNKVIVACELTNIYSDPMNNEKGGSHKKRLFEKWKRIAQEIQCKLDQEGLEDAYGVLFFKEP